MTVRKYCFDSNTLVNTNSFVRLFVLRTFLCLSLYHFLSIIICVSDSVILFPLVPVLPLFLLTSFLSLSLYHFLSISVSLSLSFSSLFSPFFPSLSLSAPPFSLFQWITFCLFLCLSVCHSLPSSLPSSSLSLSPPPFSLFRCITFCLFLCL